MTILLGMRRSAVLAAGLACAVMVTGCSGGDDDDDRQRVDAVEAASLGAVDGVLHDIAEQVGMEFGSGSHFFSICGESYAPRGVVHRVLANFELTTELPEDDAIASIVDLLEKDGWQTETTTASVPTVVGTKDDNTLQLELGGVVAVSISSDCVETSDGFARDEAKVPRADIEWK